MIQVESPSPGLRTAILSRPEKGNALSAELVESLIDVATSAEGDPDVHTLAFSTSGNDFCSGFDLSSIESESDATLLHRFVRVELLLSMIWHSRLQTVAWARGKTWGAGADLFAACSHRICESDASFRFPGARFGLVLGTRRLAERVGTELARKLVANGDSLRSEQALDCGLVSELRSDKFEDHVPAWSKPLVADRYTSDMLWSVTRPDHRDSDLANLVRSAARPGLKERVVRYREAMRAAASKPR
jgi:enoyl-CoA hydratase/carnithine racemase